MKCANCGAELKIGCVYCSVCGKEAQIVPDYNIMEDDFLKELLDEEQKQKEAKQQQKEEEVRRKKQSEQEKKHKKKIMLITGAVVAAVAVITITVIVVIGQNHKKSFDYQYKKGLEYAASNDYDKALTYLKRASLIEPENTDALLALAKVNMKHKETVSAEANLLQVISLDAGHMEAYKLLIDLYGKEKKYDKITDLYQNIKDDSVKHLFEDYLVVEPEFSLESGEYDDAMEIELTASNGCVIYYTTNGSSPIEDGKKYNEALIFEKEGEYTIKAVAKDERGLYSEIAVAEYEIKFAAPDRAEVTPSAGSFAEPQSITIHVPEGAKAYYTWDGGNPTTASNVYTEPLEMPEGNNILSVLLVDKHGLASPVVRFNYVYLPSVDEEEKEESAE